MLLIFVISINNSHPILVAVKTEPTIEQQTDTATAPLNLKTVKTEPLNSYDQNCTEPVPSERSATPTIPLSKNYQLQEEYPQLRCNDNCIGFYISRMIYYLFI
jgi:hypothetical protein